MTNPVRILVAFDSWEGHCARVAERVGEGARSDGAEVVLKRVQDCSRRDFRGLDGLILGSPVHQRSVAWPMKKFIDELCEPSWFYDDMVGRAGGVFTTGGGHGDAGAGCELAQLAMLANLASMGLVLVPFPKVTEGFDSAGMHWGPHVRVTGPDMRPLPPEGLPDEALRGAFHYGASVSRVGSALAKRAGGALFDRGGLFAPPDVLKARAEKDGIDGAQGSPR